MAEKKATKKRSVRYLLSADRRMQKLSLRKISERFNAARARAQAPRAKERAGKAPAGKEMDTSAPPSSLRWAIAAGVVVVIVGAVMMSATPTVPADETLAELRDAPTNAAVAPTISKPAAPKRAAPKTNQAPAVEPTTEEASGIDPKPAPTAGQVAPVTIVGCLQRDGDTFWLRDASGDDAPKARSWKTGFLTRRSARVDLVDSRGLNLASHVGARVAATGTLADRELHARSVRPIAATCN